MTTGKNLSWVGDEMVRFFRWKAIDAQGTVRYGKWEAHEGIQVKSRLRENGMIPLKIRAHRQIRVSYTSKTEGYQYWISLTMRLTVILKAGVPLLTALEMLASHKEGAGKKLEWGTLTEGIRNGRLLSEVLAKIEPAPPFFVLSLIKSGERSGRLIEALEQAGAQMEQEYTFLRRIKKSLSYPLLLLIMIGSLTYVFSLWIIPLYEDLYFSAQVPMPFLTKAVFVAGRLMPYSLGIIALAPIIFWSIGKLRNGPEWREKWEWMKRRLPLVGNLYCLSDLVQCTLILGNLLDSGMGILEALRLTGAHSSAPEVKAWSDQGVKGIKSGLRLSALFRSAPRLFPPLACDLLATGEKTGQLEKMLTHVSRIYTQELYGKLDLWGKRAEPMMILGAALVVGLLALGVLLPLTDAGTYMHTG